MGPLLDTAQASREMSGTASQMVMHALWDQGQRVVSGEEQGSTHHPATSQRRLRGCRVKPRADAWQLRQGGGRGWAGERGWWSPLGPGRGAEALKLFSWISPSLQVPALIAKTMPTVNAVNYALGSEMVHRGTWQCLSPQRRERSREQ